MVLLPDFFCNSFEISWKLGLGIFLLETTPTFSTVNNIKMMAMLAYEMGLIRNYMLCIIFLEELLVTQLVKKFTNFVNWLLMSSLELVAVLI